MVVHQAVAQALPAEPPNGLAQQREVPLAVLVVEVDGTLDDTAREHVMDRAGFFLSRLPWHTDKRPPAANFAPRLRTRVRPLP